MQVLTPSSLVAALPHFDASGTAVTIGLACGYVAAARRLAAKGKRWPTRRTVTYLAGVILLEVTLFSGLGQLDGYLSVHVVQHMVLMMAVAPLLVAGAPFRLLLRSLPQNRRKALVEIGRDPAVRSVTARPWSVPLLVADYYGSMAVYLHTSLVRWSLTYAWFHVAVHIYFMLCGALFWAPLLGQDPLGRRVAYRTGLLMTAAGVPLNALLGVSLMIGEPEQTAGWAALAAGCTLSAVGTAVAVARHRSRGAVAVAGARRMQWHAVS